MLAAEEVAILFEQEAATADLVAAMAVDAEEDHHIGCCLRVDFGSLLVREAEAHDDNLVFAISIGLDFEEERERLGCARCRRD